MTDHLVLLAYTSRSAPAAVLLNRQQISAIWRYIALQHFGVQSLYSRVAVFMDDLHPWTGGVARMAFLAVAISALIYFKQARPIYLHIHGTL